ncbi:MAG: ATP-binding protein [Betaproteobacteria bacterium]
MYETVIPAEETKRVWSIPFPYLKALYYTCFRSHLSLALGVAIMLLGITGGLTTYHVRSGIDQHFSKQAILAQQHLTNEIRYINTLVEAYASSSAVHEYLATVRPENKRNANFPDGKLGLMPAVVSMAIHNIHGRTLSRSDKTATMADGYDSLLSEVISTGKPRSSISTKVGADRYFLGYPIFLPGSWQPQGVLMAEVNLAQLAEQALIISSPGMMAELRFASGSRMLKIGSLPDGKERFNVTLALNQAEDILPPLTMTFSQTKNILQQPLFQTYLFYIFLLLLVIGIIVYATYRIAGTSSGFARCEGGNGSTACAAGLTKRLLLQEQAIMASSSGFIIVAMTRWPNRIEFVNPAFVVITGFTTVESLGQTPEKLFWRETDQPGLQKLNKAIQEEKSITVTMQNYRKDGTYFWNELTVSPLYDEKSRLTHYLGIFNDVTPHKLTELALLAHGKRLDNLVSLSENGLLTIDEKRCVSYANDAFLCMFGLTSAEIFGLELETLNQRLAEQCDPRHTYSLIHVCPSDACSQRIMVDGFLKCSCATEIHITRPQKRVLLRKIRPNFQENTLQFYFQDITKAWEVEETKSEFMATAAHELRTPMASILGFSELLLQRDYDKKNSRDLIEIIARQARRVTDLLNELLDLARIEARRGKDFNLAVHDLRLIVQAVATSTESTDRVILDIPDHAALVKIDEEKIHQALSNLLSNALKYSPQDKSVHISLIQASDEIPPCIKVAFKDQGIGLSATHLAHIGERFWRADTSGVIPGTGLGMSLVNEITHLHGGSIEINSALGKGSCITLCLPISVPESVELAT